eukprot:CAMPEP_0184092366 /NCGR_PEP_ID=MMETSP0974-20121125/8211_1 /TAXON_ID=483370 /ORGANISM="non described non described, Strain CCMP2097" /LENGTH=98 /DNA_ID=CAMNT_0026395123 /DNA_START=112 /DNA_END=409 /DNA_ORIENTATION=-
MRPSAATQRGTAQSPRDKPAAAKGRVPPRRINVRVQPDKSDGLEPLRAQLARLVCLPLLQDPEPQPGAVGCRETMRHGAVAVRLVESLQQLEVPPVSL